MRKPVRFQTTFSDKNESFGVRFSFKLIFIICLSLPRFTKIMFYFVSKHLRHFIGSTKVLGWKPFIVSMGEVKYFVYTVIAIHIDPDLLQLSFKISMMVQ